MIFKEKYKETICIRTIFEQYAIWINSSGESVELSEMSISHTINIIKLLIRKPEVILSILVKDIESCIDFHNGRDFRKLKKKAMKKITSMSNEELINEFISSKLFEGFRFKLEKAGVNVNNILSQTIGYIND